MCLAAMVSCCLFRCWRRPSRLPLCDEAAPMQCGIARVACLARKARGWATAVCLPQRRFCWARRHSLAPTYHPQYASPGGLRVRPQPAHTAHSSRPALIPPFVAICFFYPRRWATCPSSTCPCGARRRSASWSIPPAPLPRWARRCACLYVSGRLLFAMGNTHSLLLLAPSAVPRLGLSVSLLLSTGALQDITAKMEAELQHGLAMCEAEVMAFIEPLEQVGDDSPD